jgi:hypothetical protein
MAYPLTDVPWTDGRAQAMKQSFGAPKTVQHVVFSMAAAKRVPPIHVWEWPDRCGPNQTLLMTEGLSDVTLFDHTGNPAGFRLELLTVCNDAAGRADHRGRDFAGNMLRVVAESFVTLYGCRFMSVGETLSLTPTVQPVIPGATMTRFVFLPPPGALRACGERMLQFHITGQRVLTLWCAPIGEPELELLDRIGRDAFAGLLAEQSLAIDLQRPMLRPHG